MTTETGQIVDTSLEPIGSASRLLITATGLLSRIEKVPLAGELRASTQADRASLHHGPPDHEYDPRRP